MFQCSKHLSFMFASQGISNDGKISLLYRDVDELQNGTE
ncbi:MAG: hypothetical protein RHS_3945 [Robinsoniella sp. RHS]|nr:MAG: hypothetical protein RHS_3945 [Robinsoniella sp. RHS]